MKPPRVAILNRFDLAVPNTGDAANATAAEQPSAAPSGHLISSNPRHGTPLQTWTGPPIWPAPPPRSPHSAPRPARRLERKRARRDGQEARRDAFELRRPGLFSAKGSSSDPPSAPGGVTALLFLRSFWGETWAKAAELNSHLRR